MPLWTRVACFVVLIFLAASPAPAQDDGLTSNELRALPPKQADKQARRDLESVLLPAGQYPHGMRIEVGTKWISTRPYSLEIPGICAQDTLVLLYAPVEAGKADPDRVVEPYGLESMRNYALLKAPYPDMLDDTGDNARLRQQSACRALSRNQETVWISAKDPVLIVQGWLAFDAAFGGVDNGSLQLANCNIWPGTEKRDCISEFKARHTYARLASVDQCDAEKGQQCFRLDIDGMWITVTVRAGADFHRLDTTDIEQAGLDEYIVVT